MNLQPLSPFTPAGNVYALPLKGQRPLPFATPTIHFGNEGGKKGKHIVFRKIFYAVSAVSVPIVEAVAHYYPSVRIAYAGILPAIGIGVANIIQTRHSLLRNFPFIALGRWGFEAQRKKINQYMEHDTEGAPFTRKERDTVYRLCKDISDTQPFGTEEDVNAVGYRWINHSIKPVTPLDHEPRIQIGGPDCKKPYSASLFNVSAMSYGALSDNAILALNKGAKTDNFYHNTGEGGISPYHLGVDVDIEDPKFEMGKFLKDHNYRFKNGGDLVWQIGTGYFGCRTLEGKFDPVAFKEKAQMENVKMIELKLSQGAKPGMGGKLPAEKITPGIAKLRGIPMGKDCISPSAHSTFSTPREMVRFLKELRDLSGGKPVGFKLCVGNKHEFLAICKAMREEKSYPDFITVDGSEGGTGAAPKLFSDWVGMPLNEGLIFVHNALMGAGLRDKIKIIAAGKVIDGKDVLVRKAMGADICNSARGMMFALGCIQAQECHLNTCPTGVATQDEDLVYGLVVEDKYKRVANYHKNLVKEVLQLCGAAGLTDPAKLRPKHIHQRLTPTTDNHLGEIYEYIKRNSLLTPETVPNSFKSDWGNADPDNFMSIEDQAEEAAEKSGLNTSA